MEQDPIPRKEGRKAECVSALEHLASVDGQVPGSIPIVIVRAKRN